MVIARSRCDLRGGIPPASRWHGYRRGRVESVESMAESVRGEADWFNQARLPEPCSYPQRAAFAPSPGRLLCVLSQLTNASLVGERRTNSPTRAGRQRG